MPITGTNCLNKAQETDAESLKFTCKWFIKEKAVRVVGLGR